MTILLFIISLILFISLVVVHEFGHFIIARRNGVKVEEFGIGFPPAFWHKKMKSGFDLTLNWLPLGGFVRLKGEHDSDTAPGSYGAANLWVKTKIMIAGVIMNLVAAFVLLTILAWVGMPQLIDHQFTVSSDAKVLQDKVVVGALDSGSPAARAGLQENDQILKIGKKGNSLQAVTTANNLPDQTKHLAGQPVTIVYSRSGQTHTTNTTLLSKKTVDASQNTSNPQGYLGIEPVSFSLIRSTWSAPIVALGFMKQFLILTFQGLGNIVTSLVRGKAGQASSQVTGPIGIYFLLKNGSQLGIQFVLIIIAIISLALAIMNILPIPALDGGRLFLTLGSHLFRKKLKQHTEELVNTIGFVVLLFLIILISIADVKRHH